MDFIRHLVPQWEAQPKALSFNALSATLTTESATGLLIKTMRLTGLILLTLCLQVSARSDAHQGKANDVTSFKETTPMTAAVKDTMVEDTPANIGQGGAIKVQGVVLTEAGVPLAGACVTIRQMKKGTITNEKGAFEFSHKIPAGSDLVISYVGYAPQIVTVRDRSHFRIYVKVVQNNLDNVILLAYGTTTQRLTTEDVGKVTTDEIERQPVTNPLEALEGKVPGLEVLTFYPSVSAHVGQKHKTHAARKDLKRGERTFSYPCKYDLGSSATGGNFQVSKKCPEAEITTIVYIIIESYKT
jgi:hypothetical protein